MTVETMKNLLTTTTVHPILNTNVAVQQALWLIINLKGERVSANIMAKQEVKSLGTRQYELGVAFLKLGQEKPETFAETATKLGQEAVKLQIEATEEIFGAYSEAVRQGVSNVVKSGFVPASLINSAAIEQVLKFQKDILDKSISQIKI